MAQNQTVVTRTSKIKSWLQSVQHNRQVFGYDIQTAVRGSQQSFPSNWILKFSVALVKDWVKKYVRSEIMVAATSLGIQLSDLDLDVLTDIAVAGIGG